MSKKAQKMQKNADQVNQERSEDPDYDATEHVHVDHEADEDHTDNP